MNKTYPVDLQKLFLEIMLSDAQSFVRVQNIFNAENFDRSLREAAKFVSAHTTKHSVLPNLEQVQAVAGVDLRRVELEPAQLDWFFEEFEGFTRRQELERAILKAADLIEKGEYDPVERLIKDAVQISLTKDLGTDYWADPAARINRYFNSGGQVSTGWPQLDKIMYGGFSRGELNIFAGGSGSGKSLVMMNMALNWLYQGLHGVYITLELSEELSGLRTDAMLNDISTKEIRKNIDDAALKIRIASKRAGSYRIKYLPAQSTVNDIRSFLKEYQIQTGHSVDFVMIDYLDLLMPVSAKVSPNDLFVKDKYVSEELRNLSKELGVLMITASQLNRCLSLDTQVCVNGEDKEIRHVEIGDQLDSNGSPVTVTEILPITTQAVYKIKTKSGKEIICSSKHLFPTENGLRNIENGLSAGEKLYTRIVGDQA